MKDKVATVNSVSVIFHPFALCRRNEGLANCDAPKSVLSYGGNLTHSNQLVLNLCDSLPHQRGATVPLEPKPETELHPCAENVACHPCT